ncbi:MAG: putative Ig domain-containing protein [Flavobacterium sp.]|nr:putative Ig domain-containing protein [Flavobacterium sp.]
MLFLERQRQLVATSYSVTAFNSGGSVSFAVVITVNDVAPSALSYNSPNVFTRGTTISSLNPTISGGAVTSYSIAPALPSGLSFDTTTGVISGTPSVIVSTTSYTVTAFNSGGSTSFAVDITINDIAPNTLSYPTPNVFTIGTAISDLTPTILGDVISYSISPSLPDGLAFDTATGVISGTPTGIVNATSYTVTAMNSGGSVSFTLSITVNDLAPNSLSYPSPNVFVLGTNISSVNPSVSGGAVTSYSISPALPSGFSFNSATGVISGTPTAISSSATYTVTAINTGGSTTFAVVITVNDVAPSALSYNSPNVFTRGTTISSLNPTISGGTVTSYSISPALPNGLSFDTSTGFISGTPTAISVTATYTVTAFNSGGSTTFGVVITVNDIAPNTLSYNSPNVYTIGNAISNLNPTISGGAVTSYSISPTLPNGLSFNTATGVISGTPTAISVTATYTVTAFNSGGSTTFGVVITVNDIAPNTLSYNSPNVYTIGNAISNLNPTVSGGAVTSYSITPALPSGLSFDAATGVISGTPTAISSSATYTVTANNTGGSTTFAVVITVNDVAPSALSYNSPNVFTRGTTISSLNPTISGGTVTSYSISPALPNGLSFDTSTGFISGTPTAISATTTYTVTAFNSGGSNTFGVVITVNDIAPNTLSYPTPNVFTLGTAISDLTPTILGDVISYSISPSLPDGLAFDTATGVISGTPTTISATATYTVTAFNSGGSVSFVIQISVNDLAPSGLSYPSPNVFTVGTAIADLTPSVLGAVLSYSISPSLPDGLAFDTATGLISGTPTTISDTAFYTIIAFNSGGSVSFEIQITVNDVAPSGLSYPSPNVFTVGTAISDLIPTVLGAVLSYSISPSLPDGLAFDNTTGIISGTPTTISAAAFYTVTAFNSGGSVSFEIQITVNDAAPSGLSYPSPNVFIVGTAISDLNPTISGGDVTSYSISPSLPDGLAFDNTTGIISGTPTTISETASYTVTASNPGGSTSFEVIITVEELLSSNENQFKNISIYPNPFLDIINVNGSILNGTFTVYSVDGKLVQEGVLIGSVINVKHVPSGIYFLKLSDKVYQERIFKVIKR